MQQITIIFDHNIPAEQCFIFHHVTALWGESILIMEREGRAFCRIYWYNDDSTTVCLDWLSVDAEVRKQGIGTRLQEIREEIGKNRGATFSCLQVEKNSWMHAWYKRRGYADWVDNESEENTIWMKKSLIS